MTLSRRPLLLATLFAAVAACLSAPPPACAFERLHHRPYAHLEGKEVVSVVVLGNTHTKERVLLREMRLQVGRPFSSRELWRDWERLADLAIFAHLEVDAVASGEGVLVAVCVSERPTWFATPTVSYSQEEGEVTPGFDVRLRNLGGMNRRFRARGIVRPGGGHSAVASWSTPWIGTVKQGLTVYARDSRPDEDDHDGIALTQGGISTVRYLGDYRGVRQGLTGGLRLDFISRDAGSPSGEVHETSPALLLGVFRDTRNVRIDPSRGGVLSSRSEVTRGLNTGEPSYLRTSFDARGFHHVRQDLLLATRATATLTTGEVPEYRLLTAGGPSSIRGQPDGVLTGKNVARMSLEMRFPLMGLRRFILPMPFLPSSLSNFDLRIDGEVFADAGTAWDDSPGFGHAQVKAGAGLGLRIFLPVLELVRIEVAFDSSGRPSFYVIEGNLI
ncbi:MAG: BamA/TamA family outer membrane protein [Gemmatimonadota bacterium]|nr:BamA/TamA family outer membrane protein [Gemmatimonadota bacterium]